MKLIRPKTLVIYMLAGLSGVALLHTSQSVQRAEEKKVALERDIASSKEQIRMLQAEWVHLNRPERLEALANEFLDLVPPAPERMLDRELVIHEQNEGIETQAVSVMPAIPAPVKPKEEALPPAKKSPSKSFDSLLKELGDEDGGAQ